MHGSNLLFFFPIPSYKEFSERFVNENRSLYRQIKEKDRLEEELSLMEQQYGKQSRSATQANAETSDEETPTPQAEFRQRELVKRLRTLLLRKSKLLAAGLSRDELASALRMTVWRRYELPLSERSIRTMRYNSRESRIAGAGITNPYQR